MSLRSPVRAITAGFKPATLTKAAAVSAGAIGNAWLSGAVSNVLPDFAQGTAGRLVTGLATAGLLGAGVGMAMPRMRAPVFFGGVLQVVLGAAKEFVLPAIGMGDYLTRTNVAEARPLGYYGDYLTRANAAEARPLGGMADNTVGEELAYYG